MIHNPKASFAIKALARLTLTAGLVGTQAAWAQSPINLEGLLRGVATEMLRATQPSQAPAQDAGSTSASMPSASASSLALETPQAVQRMIDEELRLVTDPGYRIVPSAFRGFWHWGNPNNPSAAMMLVSRDGTLVYEGSGRTRERTAPGVFRVLSASERLDKAQYIWAQIQPQYLVALSPSASAGGPILLTAPNCAACQTLDRVIRASNTEQAYAVHALPYSLGNDWASAYSSILCSANPSQALNEAFASRGQRMPPAVRANCDQRMAGSAIDVVLHDVNGLGNRRVFPKLFRADGKQTRINFTTPEAWKESLAAARQP